MSIRWRFIRTSFSSRARLSPAQLATTSNPSKTLPIPALCLRRIMETVRGQRNSLKEFLERIVFVLLLSCQAPSRHQSQSRLLLVNVILRTVCISLFLSLSLSHTKSIQGTGLGPLYGRSYNRTAYQNQSLVYMHNDKENLQQEERDILDKRDLLRLTNRFLTTSCHTQKQHS